MFSLEGKIALVTGAAHGIGFAIATALGEAGAEVAFNGLNKEHLEEGLAAYAQAGIKARGYICDVTDEGAVNALVNKINGELGRIDILVNNAGVTKRGPMTDFDVGDLRKIIDVDLTGPFIVSKAVLPQMVERRNGKIINICSMMSEVGRETNIPYTAAKGGLKMLTKGIASEYGRHNIQCNGLGPGYIESPITAPLRTPGNPFNEFIINRTPAARWGTPDDLKGAAVFLASPASDFVNGHILYVDGGILATLGSYSQ